MTPAMQQFHEIKADYPDHIVLFRMGDFYETFYDDAKRASAILNITLTARDRERKVPMAGIPFHALDNYLGKLVDEGQKVVIVEQLEDPKEAKGVVKRGIVKIVTPGTNTLEKNTKEHNYLLALDHVNGSFELSFLDINEGTVYLSVFSNVHDLQNNIQILGSKEILLSEEGQYEEYLSKDFITKYSKALTKIVTRYFESLVYEERFTEQLKRELTKYPNRSLNALFNYIAETQKTDLSHLNKIVKVSTGARMNLDSAAVRNLELIEGSRKGSLSLFSLIDSCRTTSGSKLLKNWLVAPLVDVNGILKRQESIFLFKESGIDSLQSLKEQLSSLHDLSRIASKVGLSTANARDLRNLVESVKQILQLTVMLKSMTLSERVVKLISEAEESVSGAEKVLLAIDTTVTDVPPLLVRDGGMIRSGVDETLDQLHDLKNGGKEWLKTFEQEEIKRLGISTLKVRFNKVFGYYIEVSKGQSSKVPEYFIRKQTLVNAERYITPELKEQESNILGADDRIRKIEFDIFTTLLKETSIIIPQLQRLNEIIAEIDVYSALASCAIEYSWEKPEIDDEERITIQGGRHPVIEYLQKKEGKNFIQNSISFSSECSLQIITGPNMGGKSTFIRQVALIVLLAQIGSFVPAEKATIGIVDRIFTRVGASDNLSQGESTFMVEMLESGEILHNATSKSLVILDEVGRGTSTFDGMSIAWAICEFLQKLGAKTLFATHYHELTELANKHKNIKNLSVKVVDYEGEIVFMHQIVEGKADKSYGIHVAQLANLPPTVIKTAQQVLKLLEKEKNKLTPKPQNLFGGDELSEEETPEHVSVIEEELKQLDINILTPIEAIQKIHEWKKLIR